MKRATCSFQWNFSWCQRYNGFSFAINCTFLNGFFLVLLPVTTGLGLNPTVFFYISVLVPFPLLFLLMFLSYYCSFPLFVFLSSSCSCDLSSCCSSPFMSQFLCSPDDLLCSPDVVPCMIFSAHLMVFHA